MKATAFDRIVRVTGVTAVTGMVTLQTIFDVPIFQP